MRGAPKDFSITTLRPLGPSVTFTASARMSTPRSILSRASEENLTSLAAMGFASRYVQKIQERAFRENLLRDDAHDVGFLHDQEILTIDTHLGAGPFAEEHTIAGLHIEGDDFAALVTGAGADGDDLALLRLLLGGVRDDDAAGRLLFGFDAADGTSWVCLLDMRLKALVCAERHD